MTDNSDAARQRGLFGLLGIRVVSSGIGAAELEMEVDDKHMAPNGYLHGGAIVALADSAAGAGCKSSLPEGGVSFTTIELKTNFLRTVREGVIVAHAICQHGGRTTQVWDVTVTARESDKKLAEFRCTQLIVYGN
ncbi:MAG: PaaI family thioesterase [Pseudomonadota bacterium]